MTTPSYDAKYNDRDVRESLFLQQAAIEYLWAYSGDFEFLVRAKQVAMVGTTPSIATLRGVLNCMRADPSVEMRGYSRPQPRPLRAVEIRRPARVRLHATFKMPYLTSTWSTAILTHLLDLNRTALWWYPHTETYQWVPSIYCNLHLSGQVQMLNTDTIPAGKKLCRRCVETRGY